MRAEAGERFAEGVPKPGDGSGGDLSQERFELGEGLLDGIEIGAIGRQVDEHRATSLDRLAYAGNFVARHNDDVAWRQRRSEDLFNIGEEHDAIHGAVNDQRSDKAVIYFSDQTHNSIEKGLRVLGFAREQIRGLPSDENFRLQTESLRRAVAEDRADGKQPFCVIANAGTTNTGAVDPLDELADLCERENLWLHVDGAYGAAAALCERGRKLLAGIERADSLSLDPHKWLFQPFEIGCVLLRDASLLKKTFNTMAGILEDTRRAEEEEINYYDYGVQLTRSFRALKLWLSIKTFGAAAFRKAIDHGFELAEFAENILRQSDCWRIVTSATMGIVTFRYVAQGCSEGEANEIHRRMVEMMSEDGFAFANSTAMRGQTVMRLCTINPRTTEEDVRATIEQLELFGNELRNRIGSATTKSKSYE